MSAMHSWSGNTHHIPPHQSTSKSQKSHGWKHGATVLCLVGYAHFWKNSFSLNSKKMWWHVPGIHCLGHPSIASSAANESWTHSKASATGIADEITSKRTCQNCQITKPFWVLVGCAVTDIYGCLTFDHCMKWRPTRCTWLRDDETQTSNWWFPEPKKP